MNKKTQSKIYKNAIKMFKLGAAAIALGIFMLMTPIANYAGFPIAVGFVSMVLAVQYGNAINRILDINN